MVIECNDAEQRKGEGAATADCEKRVVAADSSVISAKRQKREGERDTENRLETDMAEVSTRQ